MYNTLGETTCCAWRHVICCSSFFCFAYVAHIDVFSPHSNDMTSWQNSSAEKISCNVTPFFYHHSVVIQHLVSDTLYQTSLNSKKTCKMLDKIFYFLKTYENTYYIKHNLWNILFSVFFSLQHVHLHISHMRVFLQYNFPNTTCVQNLWALQSWWAEICSL